MMHPTIEHSYDSLTLLQVTVCVQNFCFWEKNPSESCRVGQRHLAIEVHTIRLYASSSVEAS